MVAALRCPICKRELPPSEGRPRFGSFCSERCRSIDLGSWLEGRYAIPVTAADDEDGSGATPAGERESEDADKSRLRS